MLLFLCDVMSKQNQHNVSLPGETKSVCDIWQIIQAFRKKLTLLNFIIHDTNQELFGISDNRCSLGRSTNLKINDVKPKIASLAYDK